MTYPPDPGRRPDRPPADPYLSPPSWEPYGSPGPYGTSPSPGSGAPGGADHPYGAPPPHRPSSPPPYGPSSPPPYGPSSWSPSGPDEPGGPQPYGPGGPGGPPVPYGQGGPFPPPRRSRRGLLIVGAALAAVLVLCGGGGLGAFLLLRDTDRDGAESPTAAVQSFLQAVYRDLDSTAAAAMVCSEARDESALATKLDEIAAYDDVHAEPRFTWSSPQVVDQTEELAVVATTVTMITRDEKTADLSLRVSVLDKGQHGWWVCDLETTAAEPDPPAEDQDESGESSGESEESSESGESGESGDGESGDGESGDGESGDGESGDGEYGGG